MPQTGTLIPAPINTLAAGDNYATHVDVRGQGGFRAVGTASDRTSILSNLRSEGMLIYEIDTGKTYQLASDLTTWNDVTAALAAVLASTASGKGASLVGLQGGGTVQDFTSTASGKGASLIPFEGSTGTVQDLTGIGGGAIVGTDDGWANAAASLNARAQVFADYTAAAAITSAYTANVMVIQSADGGVFRYDASDTTSTADGNGYCGTIIVDAAGRRWKRQFNGTISPAMFGAYGLGADETTQLTTTLNFACSNSVSLLSPPNLSYLVTDEILYSGDSSNTVLDFNNSYIFQQTDNKPCLHLDGYNNSSRNEIKNLKGKWLNDQPSANKNSAVVLLSKQTASAPNVNFYNNRFINITSDNGCRVISHTDNGSSGYCNVWGNTWDQIFAGNACSGATLYLDPGANGGQPHNVFLQIYSQAANITDGEPAFYLKAQNQFVIGAIETNNCTSYIVHFSSCNGIVGTIHNEVGNFGETQLIWNESGRIQIGDIYVGTSTLVAGTNVVYSHPVASTSWTKLGSFSEASNTCGSGCYVIGGFGYPIQFDYPIPPTSANLALWDISGSGPLDKLHVASFSLENTNHSDNGDSDKTFTPLVDANAQQFNTTLTANRSVTLSRTNAYNGASFTIVRNATTPGAFTLAIYDAASPGTPKHTISASKNGTVTMAFDRSFGWFVKTYSPES